jgi:hypothetical protein
MNVVRHFQVSQAQMERDVEQMRRTDRANRAWERLVNAVLVVVGVGVLATVMVQS